MIELQLTGLDALKKNMAAVTHDLRRKGGRAALRKSANLVVAAAKQNAQSFDDTETGRSIASNVAARWNNRLFKRTGDLGFRVGILKGAVTPKKGDPVDKSAGGPTPHWRLLEFGTSKMPAQPFLRRALSDNVQAATDTFVREYTKSLDRAIKRMSK